MKKTFFAAALIATFGAAVVIAPKAALASDGTVVISGQINAGSCTVNGQTTTAANIAVTLPTLSSNSLKGVGTTSGGRSFSIVLTNCPASLTTAHAYWETNALIDPSTNNLVNTAAGGATGVQAQIVNGFGNSRQGAILLSMPDSPGGASQNSGAVTLTGGSGTLNYIAQYYQSASTVTVGPFQSNVTFSMSYQ